MEIVAIVAVLIWTLFRFMRCEECGIPFSAAQAFYRVVTLERNCSRCVRLRGG